MKMLVLKPGKEPELVTWNGDLSVINDTVGGYVEPIYFASNAVALVDEEGLIKGLMPNIRLTDNFGRVLHLVGTVCMLGVKQGEFVSVPTNIVKKYMPRK